MSVEQIKEAIPQLTLEERADVTSVFMLGPVNDGNPSTLIEL
jgi:hypothetical protein